MKKSALLLSLLLVSSIFTTGAMASAKKGKRFYLKKLKICKKDGIKNGGIFAAKYSRQKWTKLDELGKLQEEWKTICPHGEKKIKKMREKDIKNLYDFVWKYASDGETPSCG